MLLEEIPSLKETEMIFSISDITLVESGPMAVLASPKKVALHIAKMVKAGQEPERVKGLWHTHPGFRPTWSGADESGIRKMLNVGLLATRNPWALSICASGAWISSRVDWIADGHRLTSDLILDPIPGLDPLWFKQVKEIIASSEDWRRDRFFTEPVETYLPIWDQQELDLLAFREELNPPSESLPYRYCPLRGADVETEYCEVCTLHADCWEENLNV